MSEIIIYPFLFLSTYFLVFMLYNFITNRNKIKEEELPIFDYFPKLTFLIPSWNEGNSGGIYNSIKSIQDLDYPKDNIRIIVIDNNSTDNTKEIVNNIISEDNRIKYLFEPKQGKHNAMNKGLDYVETPYVATLDADSVIASDSIKIAMQYFKDRETMALCSAMQIHNIKTIWQKAQSIEYLLAIFWRKAYATIDAIQVMPGPLSIFRKDVFDNLGKYKPAHNAEDFEITLRMHLNHYKIKNSHLAAVYTTGPTTLRGLYRQRLRWFQGYMGNLWDYRGMIFKKKYGNFGLFTLPMATIFMFYTLYAFFLFWDFIIMWLYNKINIIINTGISFPKFSFDTFYINGDILLFIGVFEIVILVYVVYVASTIVNNRVKVLPEFFLYFLIYPIIMPYFVLIAFIKFILRKDIKWVLQDNKISNTI